MKLSIIIPAYNEEKRIIPTLEEYYNFFNDKFRNEFEIIVIPNNCKDNTLEITQKFAKNKKQIRVFNIPNYSGKGRAVMTGFELAKGEYIGFSDADNSTNPENFYKLYKYKDNYAGIVGSRKIKGAIINPKRRKMQDLSSFFFNLFVKLLFNLKYYDTQCGAKLFKKNIAKFLVKNYLESGWIFDVNLLYLCKKNGFKIYEYPINWKDSEGSKLTIKDGFVSILKLFKYKFKTIFYGL
ncbi:MAG: dolichyl-phosphate beta-glucosyltransferase [Nanoarchaeota archaeon]